MMQSLLITKFSRYPIVSALLWICLGENYYVAYKNKSNTQEILRSKSGNVYYENGGEIKICLGSSSLFGFSSSQRTVSIYKDDGSMLSEAIVDVADVESWGYYVSDEIEDDSSQ